MITIQMLCHGLNRYLPSRVTPMITRISLVLGLITVTACDPTPTVTSKTGLPIAIEQTLEQYGVSWLPRPLPIGNHPFIDQNGNPINMEALQGRWNLAFFGFTFCPDICPMTLSRLSRARRQAQQLTGDPAVAKVPAITSNQTSSTTSNSVQIVLISVDPERDKPTVLQSYLSYFGENIIGLTGNPSSLAKLSTDLHAFYAKVDQPDGGIGQNYTMDHSANIVVIGPDGDYLGYISPPHSVDQLAAISQILGQLKLRMASS